MGKETSIQWTATERADGTFSPGSTFNPWRGCTRYSSGCLHCYAETMSKRNPGVLGKWGPNGTRVVASEAKWREPHAWNHAAQKDGERHRVFCASLADVFEAWDGPMVNAKGERLYDHVFDWQAKEDGSRGPVTMDDVRIRIWKTIVETQSIDWLLLTKRPQNVLATLKRMRVIRRGRCLDDRILGDWIDGSHPPDNVWIGTSVEDQETADVRIPELLKIPAAVRFLSMEPLLGRVDISKFMIRPEVECPDGIEGCEVCHVGQPGISWVIVGGESGPKARPFDLSWARSLRDQCKSVGVSYFLKQLGANPVDSMTSPATGLNHVVPIKLKDSHGGDESEWPSDLQGLRQFPNP